jgi:hypothetical protein
MTPPTEWSEHVAALGVDTLVDHGLIRKEDFEKATAIVAEEINVRLCLNDYPSHFPGQEAGQQD